MGETILGNRYEIIKKIGDGGMAFVYEAKDKLLNRTVAVKVLRPEFVDDEEFLTKFKREAEAVASLSHPNIVNVYDVGEDGKVHYIVMELVEGKNLKDIIKTEGTLDEYTALDIAKQIARALGAAHRKGIIHRDIKPHNILISNEGRIVKVADFGIAKAATTSTITSTGTIIGSVHYFSPEQAKGKFVNNTTDLYSLGIVLYEMLLGKVPFTGDSPVSIALQHINDEIEFSQDEKIQIPQSVRNIISKLTSKSSVDRYQSADELIEDIEYIEKNIDLEFIKEYDNYATQKIDSNEIVQATQKMKPIPVAKKEDISKDINDDIVEYTPKKSNTENKEIKKNNKVKKEEDPKKKKKYVALAIILGIVLLIEVGCGLAAMGVLGNKNNSQQISAPDFYKMSLTEAQNMAKDLGITVKVRRDETNNEVPKDHIISQMPEAGTEVGKGDVITVVVSRGGDQISVPSVVGLSLTEAKDILKANNLDINVIYEENSTFTKDTVISQSPSSGYVNEGTKIELVVSKGVEDVLEPTPEESTNQVSVPSIVGMSIIEAGNLLESKGLTLGNVKYEESSKYKKDIVMTQTPSSGSVNAGTKIDVIVSLGAAEVVPKPDPTPDPIPDPTPEPDPSPENPGNDDDKDDAMEDTENPENIEQ